MSPSQTRSTWFVALIFKIWDQFRFWIASNFPHKKICIAKMETLQSLLDSSVGLLVLTNWRNSNESLLRKALPISCCTIFPKVGYYFINNDWKDFSLVFGEAYHEYFIGNTSRRASGAIDTFSRAILGFGPSFFRISSCYIKNSWVGSP